MHFINAKKREKLAGVELGVDVNFRSTPECKTLVGVDVNSEVNSRSTSAEFSQFYNF